MIVVLLSGSPRRQDFHAQLFPATSRSLSELPAVSTRSPNQPRVPRAAGVFVGRRPCRSLRELLMYCGALCSCSKIYAAQDDAWRRPLELPGHVFVGSTLFDATTKPSELGFALVRLDPVRLLEVVHRRRTDGAGNLPFPVQHREQNHHPVKLITSETAAG